MSAVREVSRYWARVGDLRRMDSWPLGEPRGTVESTPLEVVLGAEHDSVVAQLATVQGERERYKWLLQQLYTDLPAKRDWLDPAIESEIAALAQPAAPSARGRMHSCDIPECVACGNPPDVEVKQEGRDE